MADLMKMLDEKIEHVATAKAEKVWRSTAGGLWNEMKGELGVVARMPFSKEYEQLKEVAIPAIAEQFATVMRKRALARLTTTLLEDDTP